MRHVTLAARRARAYLRRPPWPRWVQLTICGGGGLLGLLVGATIGAWLTHGGPGEAWRAMTGNALAWTADAGLAVRDVFVDGRLRTPADVVRTELGVELGMPILAVDPLAAKDRLESLPWVERASIARMFPDTVHVRLLERQPLALWQRSGRFAVIDRAGHVVEGAVGHDRPAAAYRHLRVLIGDDAPRHAAPLFALLSTEPALSARVVAATRVGGRRWNLHLDNRIEVLLPEKDPLPAWRLLARKAREDALLERAVSVIDLRLLPDRLRLKLEAAVLDERPA